jgi:hypothetical protein
MSAEIGTASPLKCCVIVIDDSRRFALHVWRYLGGGLGFGIGRWPGRGPGDEAASPELKGKEDWDVFNTPLGEVEVLWVRLREKVSSTIELLETLLPSRGDSGIEFVVILDVHVEEEPTDGAKDQTKKTIATPGAAGVQAPRWKGEANSAVDRATELLKELRDKYKVHEKNCFVVSSLAVKDAVDKLKGKAFGDDVQAKTPRTLQEVRSRVDDVLDQRADVGTSVDQPSGSILHVLVTGAGFEYPSEEGGIKQFGVPGVKNLLSEMKAPFVVGRRQRQVKQEGYVLLEEGEWLPGVSPMGPGRVADNGKGGSLSATYASEMNLDQWWDWVLRHADALVTDEGRNGDLVRTAVREQERKLREAFRSVFQRYDYGQLLQALCAAQLKWTAWLTTNYTRFAERAAASSDFWARESEKREKDKDPDPSGRCRRAIFPVLKGTPSDKRPFRTIDTSAEAIFLMRELEAEAAGQVLKSNRLLFKLHGDITHLRTMAIAGEDKEAFSQLSLPVDDLHLVYASAGSLLSRYAQELRAKEKEAFLGRKLVWHIVGHGLQDKVLIELIGRVRSAAPEMTMVFKIVQPKGKASDKATELLEAGLARALGYVLTTDGEAKELFDKEPGLRKRNDIRQLDLTAERYILELARDSVRGEVPERGDSPSLGDQAPVASP